MFQINAKNLGISWHLGGTLAGSEYRNTWRWLSQSTCPLFVVEFTAVALPIFKDGTHG